MAVAAVVGILLAAGVVGSDGSPKCDPERPFRRALPPGLTYGPATPGLTERFVDLARRNREDDFGHDDVEIRAVLRGRTFVGNVTSMRPPEGVTAVEFRDFASAELANESGGSARGLELDGKPVKVVRMRVETAEITGVMGASGCRFVIVQGVQRKDVVAVARTLLAEE